MFIVHIGHYLQFLSLTQIRHVHDDVIKWKPFPPLLALCAWNSPVTGEFPTQRPVTQSFDVLLCAWINGWVNNREAGDMRRHRGDFDVIVV